MSELRIGCSGWVYKDWKGPFYPPEVKDKDRLGFYATRFDTAEINASFYRLPSEKMVAGWAERAPEGFLFAWKVSRFITHNKKLKDCEDPVALVYGRMAPLGDKAGPSLIQLPPQLKRNDERLAGFLKLLPPGRHTVEFRDRSWYDPAVFRLLPPGRHTVEFRDRSWYDPAVFRLLSDFDVSLCISDHHSAPAPWEVTASWVYVRGHGPGGRYHGNYPQAELAQWAERMSDWRAGGRDVYAYFDNDVKCAAPHDALLLKRLLRLNA